MTSEAKARRRKSKLFAGRRPGLAVFIALRGTEPAEDSIENYAGSCTFRPADRAASARGVGIRRSALAGPARPGPAASPQVVGGYRKYFETGAQSLSRIFHSRTAPGRAPS